MHRKADKRALFSSWMKLAQVGFRGTQPSTDAGPLPSSGVRRQPDPQEADLAGEAGRHGRRCPPQPLAQVLGEFRAPATVEQMADEDRVPTTDRSEPGSPSFGHWTKDLT